MTVGLCTVELYLPDGHSLKAKRQVLSSLKARLRDKFNVSVAEVGDLDLWQKAVLAIACVANEAGPNTVWINNGSGVMIDSGQALGAFNSALPFVLWFAVPATWDAFTATLDALTAPAEAATTEQAPQLEG